MVPAAVRVSSGIATRILSAAAAVVHQPCEVRFNRVPNVPGGCIYGNKEGTTSIGSGQAIQSTAISVVLEKCLRKPQAQWTVQSPLPTDRLGNALPADRWPVAPNLACRAIRRIPIRICLSLRPTAGRGPRSEHRYQSVHRPLARTGDLQFRPAGRCRVHATGEDAVAGRFHQAHAIRWTEAIRRSGSGML